MKSNYKSSRKYKCPYCDFSDIRGNLIEHVDKKHQEFIPEGYTAARAVFDYINKKNYGTCMICKKKIYDWNDKVNRYRNLCQDPKCRAEVRRIALDRHIKVYNKPTLLNDPEQQEKMLANRRISGTYIFSDGGKMTYTGKYERNALEFMDKVLNIPSKDIQAPGPVLEYEYKGEVHKWITDIYYIPANLLIEVKDGGSNPNNRTMTAYREKQVAKEVMITDAGKFNYVRLTNNNFAQLLDILADIKNEILSYDDENQKKKIHINEEVGGLPKNGPPEAYIIPYCMNHAFSGECRLAYTDTSMDKILTVDDHGHILPLTESEFRDAAKVSAPILVYKDDRNIGKKMQQIRNTSRNGRSYSPNIFAEILTGSKIAKPQSILLSPDFEYYDKSREELICNFIENATIIEASGAMDTDADVIFTKGNVRVSITPKGYYAYTKGPFSMASDCFDELESLKTSGIIDLMNDAYNTIYNTNVLKKEEINNAESE